MALPAMAVFYYAATEEGLKKGIHDSRQPGQLCQLAGNKSVAMVCQPGPAKM
jgi:hypothetical protein